jgi:hypothetical protein
MTPPTPDPGSSRPTGLDRLTPYHKQIGVGLLVTAGVLAVVALVWLVRAGTAVPVAPFGWLLGVIVVLLVAPLVNLLAPAEQADRVERLRLLLVTAGGLCGLLTALLGFVLPFTPQFYDDFWTGLARWRERPSVILWPLAALLGGMALLFVSMQLARPVERTSAGMRRLLYFSNAALGSVLLLFVLALANLLLPELSQGFSRNYNWTASGLHSLSDNTRNFVAGLRQPVMVYVLLPQDSLVMENVQTLLENCRSINGEVNWAVVSRDRNVAEYRKLMEKYALPASQGLLVLYGTEPKVEHDFINANQLEDERPGANPDDPPRYIFKGENALMKSLIYLAEGKTHAALYFTQAEGELSLAGFGRDNQQSLGVLKQRLSDGGYEVKELRFGLDVKSVPSDAAAVVIVGPRRPFTPEAVQALRAYMKGGGDKKGKLVVLLDVVAQGGAMVHTGLEELLAEYDVQVGDGRIINLQDRELGTRLDVLPNPRAANNPVAASFIRGDQAQLFHMNDARTVQRRPNLNPNPPGGGYRVDELLLVDPRDPVWSEKDLSRSPPALVAELRRPENLRRALQTISKTPLGVAVGVSESRSNLPNIPGHEGLMSGTDVPRLVVFGDAGWVSDEEINARSGQRNYDLFASTLSWLRERPDIGKQADDKESPAYVLDVKDTSVWRLLLVPLALMLLGVVGLGCGVWVVRRR